MKGKDWGKSDSRFVEIYLEAEKNAGFCKSFSGKCERKLTKEEIFMENMIDKNYKLFIGGKWVDGLAGKTFNSRHPSNGELLATCVDAGKVDVDLAVKAGGRLSLAGKTSVPCSAPICCLKSRI
jgi:hypothetical protein